MLSLYLLQIFRQWNNFGQYLSVSIRENGSLRECQNYVTKGVFTVIVLNASEICIVSQI